MPTSIAMLGSVQLPVWKVCVLSVVPVVVGAPKAPFSQNPNVSVSMGTTRFPSDVIASRTGGSGSRPYPSSSEFSRGCSVPRVERANGILKKPVAGAVP